MLSSLLLAVVLTPGEPATDFTKAWADTSRAISSRYYARVARRDEMDSLLAKYGPIARAATTRAEFRAVVERMIDEFGDSHFAFHTPDQQGYYSFDGLARGEDATPMPNIGAWFKPGDDGYTVTMVLNGLAADKAGLRKGDVVTKVDGQPFTPVASIRDRVGTSPKFTVMREDETLTKDIEVSGGPAVDMFLQATRNSQQVIERDGRRIGYFRLWAQLGDGFRNALSGFVYGRARDTSAFVLDLRDGFGGRPEGFADPFFRPEARLTWDMGGGAAMTQLFGYQRPLIVLINRGSRSAKEVLGMILKDAGRATLVGTTTAGAVLGTTPLRIADWAYLEIPMVDVRVDGVRLERVGVAPHVEVADGYGPAGEDLVLERGLQIAAEKAEASPDRTPARPLP